MSVPHIENYQFGHITIDGITYNKDLIIFPDHIQSNWWRISGHNLAVKDLEAVFKEQPDILIIGQGAYGRMHVPKDTHQALDSASINTLVMPTEEACQHYNKMRSQSKIAAALHLTC
jgi:hypothetical protein